MMQRGATMISVGCASAVLGVLTGCGSGSVPDPSLTTQQPPVPVLSADEARGLVSVPWVGFSPASSPQVAPAGAGFEVSVPVTGCPPRIRGVTVAMTATTVVVAVMADPAGPSCTPSLAKAALVYVRLPEAAAGHVVEHAPVSATGS